MIAAVIFDLDGVLLDSESVWNAARAELVAEHGGQWRPDAQRAMMGMSSTEWSAYMHDTLGVAIPPQEISGAVVARLRRLYREHLPLLPGARETVLRLARVRPLGLASSANRSIIDLALELARIDECFTVTVSSEEVAHGKPAPDVYLHAARKIGEAPERCAAVEDSTNGLRSAAAAGMTVIAVPNQDFPPAADALALAAKVLYSIEQLSPELIDWLGAGDPASDGS